jgi:hypothetical protein
MELTKLLESLVPALGQAGVDILTEEFKDLAADQDQPWKKTALALLADAVQAHGPAGIGMAQKAIQDLINHKVPNIDWASPRTASDLVAALQNASADEQSATAEFCAQVGRTLGKVLAAVIQGLLASL